MLANVVRNGQRCSCGDYGATHADQSGVTPSVDELSAVLAAEDDWYA